MKLIDIKLTEEQKIYLKQHMAITISGNRKTYAIETSGYNENILNVMSMLDSIVFIAENIAMNNEGKGDNDHLTDIMYGISSTANQCKKLLPLDISEFMDDLVSSTFES